MTKAEYERAFSHLLVEVFGKNSFSEEEMTSDFFPIYIVLAETVSKLKTATYHWICSGLKKLDNGFALKRMKTAS